MSTIAICMDFFVAGVLVSFGLVPFFENLQSEEVKLIVAILILCGLVLSVASFFGIIISFTTQDRGKRVL